jgi:predicted double-glycine peptidase
MMRLPKLLSFVAVAAIAASTAGLAPRAALATGTAQLHGEAGGTYFVQLRTLKEIRYQESFRTTIRQQYDFSCGSAALATLLTHHYQSPVSEETVFRVMYGSGDQEKIQQRGFSLLDIKRYLAAHGYEANGFEVTLDQLAEARTPALAMIRENGYNHFVVLKGVREGKVLIGDPSSGTRIMSRKDFEEIWVDQIVFVISSHQNLAQFNGANDWQIRLKAPLSDGISREALPGLMFPTANDF